MFENFIHIAPAFNFNPKIDIKAFFEKIFSLNKHLECGFYIEDYVNPTATRAFCLIFLSYDKKKKEHQLCGINFDKQGRVTYMFNSTKSLFKEDGLVYSYTTKYLKKDLIDEGEGKLELMRPSRYFLAGSFFNIDKKTIHPRLHFRMRKVQKFKDELYPVKKDFLSIGDLENWAWRYLHSKDKNVA